jgi:sulfate transporter 4
VYGSLINLFDSVSLFNYKTFLLGMAALGLLVVFKQLGSRCKRVWYLKTIGPLTVSVVGIVLVAAFNLDDKGIPIVASIPRGLPPATVELWFPITSAGELFQTVITIVLVGLMESIAIGKQLAKRHNYKIFSNQELYGLGMANMAAALFSAYPITGSFSRSAVNNEAGAQTQISSVVAATVGA